MKKPLVNSAFSLLASVVNILVSFFAQRVFLHLLNAEYLGLNGLFSNIISMLAIFELGIGSAITFSLYRPIAKNDITTIRALMNFYKKAYRIIMAIVATVGIGIMPLLPLLIKDVSIDVNIYAVYALYLADVVCSYVLTYRRSILYADQKNYQINIIHMSYSIVVNILQLTLLALTRNFYLYLGIKILMRIMENLAIHFVVRKQYNYLNKINSSKLDKKLEKDIFKKIRALLLHKIGGFIVMGSDNIIISKFIGLVEVGLYSNYYLIYRAGEQLIGQAVSALTPTVGHKLATDKANKTFNIFRKIRFINFCMACIAATLFFTCMQPLIKVWLGDQYILDILTVAMISLNLFQRLQRYTYSTFKEAAGIYHEDRFIPLVESVLNIVASILLLHFFGLAGVVMGTTISGLALWGYSYPKFVYKGIFGRSYLQYIRETLGYIFIFIICAALSYFTTQMLTVDNVYLQLIANILVSVAICIVVIAVSCKSMIIELLGNKLPYKRNRKRQYDIR